MKVKFLLSTLAISFLIFLPGLTAHADSSNQLFTSAIRDLEKHLLEQGISLREDETITDVATFGYLNALNRLKAPFGTLDTQIKKETEEWLKIWCWLPTIPEEKKEKVKKELVQVRGALAKGAYERILATPAVVPGFAVTSLGEIYPPKRLMEVIPHFGKREYVFGYVMRPGFTFRDFAEGIRSGQFGYEDIVNLDFVAKHAR